MGDYIDELCENYSHGMKQRVVFASALVHEPEVLIVDEPLVGLDPRSGRIVKDLFLEQARSGVAVLMSTHLLSIAEELADTIGIIDHGRMLLTGTLAEIRERAQMHGPLEDLFLKLTGGDRPRRSAGAGRRGRRRRRLPVEPAERPAVTAPEPRRRAVAAPPMPTALRVARGLRLPPLSPAGATTLAIAALAARGSGWLTIVICSADLLDRPLRPLLRGLPVPRSTYVSVTNEIVEYLFSLFFLSLLVMLLRLDGDHPLRGAVPVAGGGLPAGDAGADGPGLRPQVHRGDRPSRAGASCCWAAR